MKEEDMVELKDYALGKGELYRKIGILSRCVGQEEAQRNEGSTRQNLQVL